MLSHIVNILSCIVNILSRITKKNTLLPVIVKNKGTIEMFYLTMHCYKTDIQNIRTIDEKHTQCNKTFYFTPTDDLIEYCRDFLVQLV